ncbi:MAG: hypothetical protein Q8K36_03905, partial [Alphaproteobacteria bacterium]|nr:hypothetical protein [Alphaproteobacteria bacterium]
MKTMRPNQSSSMKLLRDIFMTFIYAVPLHATASTPWTADDCKTVFNKVLQSGSFKLESKAFPPPRIVALGLEEANKIKALDERRLRIFQILFQQKYFQDQILSHPEELRRICQQSTDLTIFYQVLNYLLDVNMTFLKECIHQRFQDDFTNNPSGLFRGILLAGLGTLADPKKDQERHNQICTYYQAFLNFYARHKNTRIYIPWFSNLRLSQAHSGLFYFRSSPPLTNDQLLEHAKQAYLLHNSESNRKNYANFLSFMGQHELAAKVGYYPEAKNMPHVTQTQTLILDRVDENGSMSYLATLPNHQHQEINHLLGNPEALEEAARTNPEICRMRQIYI